LVALVAAVLAIVMGAPAMVRHISFDATRLGNDSVYLIRQDASQRAILFVPRTDGKAPFSACSEPPPDVAQNIVQTLGSSLSGLGQSGSGIEGNVAAQISRDLKGTAELLFQRSQGVQLLRDTMFRLCESFQNGVITSDEYSMLIQQLIKTATLIIPFEQCTGIVRTFGSTTKELDTMVQRCLETAAVFMGSPLKKAEQPPALSTTE
jgi:hypothetical protein